MQQDSLRYLFLLMFCFFLYLPGIVALPMIDRDSPHFSQASKQMIESGNYALVKFQDKPRHLKPPGFYWLQALSLKIFNHIDSNWPYRIPGLLGSILAVLLTFGFAKRFFSSDIALLGAILLACCFLLMLETRLTVTDTLLLATMVLMQGGLWQIYVASRKSEPISFKPVLYFWLGMTAGILIKGITPLVGFLTIIGLSLADKNIAWLKKIRFGLGLSILIGLTLAWLIPVSIASGSNFLFDMVRGDVVPKLVGGQQSHGMPPGYFLAIFTLMFWPGSLFVWFGNVLSFRQRKDPVFRFLWGWVLPTWIFFEIVPTKLPEYVLPVYPAIAIMSAAGIFAAKDLILKKLSKFACSLQYLLWALLSLAMAFVIFYIPHYFLGHSEVSALMSASVLLTTIVLVAIQIYKKSYIQAAYITGVACVFIYAPIFGIVLPKMQPLWLSRQVAHTMEIKKLKADAKNTLYSVGFGEPSLVFLLGTNAVHFANFEETPDFIKKPHTKFILIDENFDQKLLELAAEQNIPLKFIAEIKGYNYSKGRWASLKLYQKQD